MIETESFLSYKEENEQKLKSMTREKSEFVSFVGHDESR